jgi:hypothetical protein
MTIDLEKTVTDAATHAVGAGKQAIRFAQSARERFFGGSGKPMPVPTDEDIAAAIRNALLPAIGDGPFGQPIAQTALLNAAHAVRQLFPTTTDAIAKDTV